MPDGQKGLTMRTSEISRKTAETDIKLWLDLDGSGNSKIKTGVGFLDHMLTLLAKHAKFDLAVTCVGDTYVDDHHSVEDIGIVLGKAFNEALGDRHGITRFGDNIIPMDEALILTSIDISGRAYLGYDVEIPTEKVGTFDTELVEEFLMAFVRNAGVTLHVIELKGRNSHHIIEGIFKSLARTLRQAVAIDAEHADDIPSTKGTLDDSDYFEDEFDDFEDYEDDEMFDVPQPGYEEHFKAGEEPEDIFAPDGGDFGEPEEIEDDEIFDEVEEETSEEVVEEVIEEEIIEEPTQEIEEPEEPEEEIFAEPEEEPEPEEEEPEEESEEEPEAKGTYDEIEEMFADAGDAPEPEQETPYEETQHIKTEDFYIDTSSPENNYYDTDITQVISAEELYKQLREMKEGKVPEEPYDEYEAEREADNAKALYSFTLPNIEEPDEISYDDIDDGSDSGLFDEDDDPSVDDVDKLAEQMARNNLSEQRKSGGSMGLGDDDYARGIAKGYTDTDIK